MNSQASHVRKRGKEKESKKHYEHKNVDKTVCTCVRLVLSFYDKMAKERTMCESKKIYVEDTF